MIDAERAESAVEFLITSAAEYGAARADAQRAENMLRVTKALHMRANGQGPVSAQERDAYASPEYQAALQDLFEASKAMETLKAQREAAVATIEAWRSVNANQRAAERGFHSHRGGS